MHAGEMSFDIDFRTRFMVLFIQTDVAKLCVSFNKYYCVLIHVLPYYITEKQKLLPYANNVHENDT